MNKSKTFEESKRVSTTKGFLGYKTNNRGILYQISNNGSTFSKKQFKSLFNEKFMEFVVKGRTSYTQKELNSIK